MSINPKYIEIASDDVRWLYQADPSSLSAMLTNPGEWIATNVPRAESARTGSYFVAFSSLPSGSGEISISGVSGTSLVTVEGFDSMVSVFANEFGVPEDPDRFWLELDNVLAPLLKFNTIELIVVPDQHRFFVHMQVAPNTAFIGMLLSAIAMDPEGYLKWLTDTSGIIPRTARLVDADGKVTPIEVSQVRILPRGTGDGGPVQQIDMFYETLTPGKCPEEYPTMIACSITEGMTVKEVVENGLPYWYVEVDKVLVKMYCVREQ